MLRHIEIQRTSTITRTMLDKWCYLLQWRVAASKMVHGWTCLATKKVTESVTNTTVVIIVNGPMHH